ncbi:LysR family transcriptional regulator [Sneathiella chinensis]|uniref:LysR family transcriptional regulator n=2 Tax=Sneathiella chinensis TaxID=349750 RepID=A0ABQ5TZI8_9PROT|nr:LysR family transcriptional regulator [Sneathiella chinensis]
MIYETGSITEAARRLGLAQPTVSRHLSYFEKALKLKLFTNERGRIKPTWEAHRLFRECDGMFERLRHIELTVNDLQRGENETFRIMVASTMANMPILANALQRVWSHRPQLKVVVDIGSSHAQVQALREGLVDLGIAGPVAMHPDIRVNVVSKIPVVALVPADHELAGKPSLSFHDFEGRSTVLLANTGPIGELIEQQFETLAVTPDVRVQVMAPTLIPSFSKSLRCCALIDSMTARFMAPQLGLLIKPVEPSLTFNIHTLRRQDSPDRQIFELFANALHAEVAPIS